MPSLTLSNNFSLFSCALFFECQTYRSTSVSSCHRKDLNASRSNSPKTTSTVTGNASNATDTSSQTATKAQSQQPSHHQQCNLGNAYPRPSSSNDGTAKKPLNPVDLKGASLVATSYASSNPKLANRSHNNGNGGGSNGNVYYPGPGVNRTRGPNNNGTYRNSFQPIGRKYHNATQYTRAHVDNWSLSPTAAMSHFGQEASALPPVIPVLSLTPAQLPNYQCMCVYCQTSNGTFLSNHSYMPAFPYYQPYYQQQVPPNAMSQAFYPGYLSDGSQLMHQAQIPQFAQAQEQQPMSYASTMVRPPLISPKVATSPLPFPRVALENKSPGPRSPYDYSGGSWFPQNQAAAAAAAAVGAAAPGNQYQAVEQVAANNGPQFSPFNRYT